jgi:hypothetical protein
VPDRRIDPVIENKMKEELGLPLGLQPVRFHPDDW